MENTFALIYPYAISPTTKHQTFRNNVLREYLIPIIGLLYKNVDASISSYIRTVGSSDEEQNLFKLVISETNKFITNQIELFAMMLPIKYEVAINDKVLPSMVDDNSWIVQFNDIGEIQNASINIYEIYEGNREDIISFIFTYTPVQNNENVIIGQINKYDDLFLAMNPMMETYLRRPNLLYAFNKHFADCDLSEKTAFKILINLFDGMLICDDDERYPKAIHNADFTVSKFKQYIDSENKTYREIILDMHSCIIDVLNGKTSFKQCKYYHLKNIF